MCLPLLPSFAVTTAPAFYMIVGSSIGFSIAIIVHEL